MKQLKIILIAVMLALSVPIVPHETRADIAANAVRDVYTGNGTTTAFAYTFKVLNQQNIAVYVGGVLQTLTTHYTITGIGNDNGGSIVMLTAPANGVQVLLLRNQPIEQISSYIDGSISASQIERDLDRQTAINQQQQEEVNRSLRFPKTVTPTTGLTEVPNPTAGDQCFRRNSANTANEWGDCGTGGGGGGGGTPGGSDTQVQFNDNAAFGGDAGLTFNKTSNVLTAGGFSGPLTGVVTGNVTGNLTGNVTGNVTGAVTGNVTGNVTGDLTGSGTGPIFNATTGFRVSGLGPSGQVLRGNGTNFVASPLAAADVTATPSGTMAGVTVEAQLVELDNKVISEVDTLQTAFARGAEITGANSSTNAFKWGNGTNKFYGYNDPTDGLIINCYITTLGNCDWMRALNAGKKWGAKNSSGVEIFTLTESTGAVTNLTADGEGSGNTITLRKKLWFPFASCQNTTAALIWNSETANAASAACITGSNAQLGVADFDATTDESLQTDYLLPSNWVGAIDARIRWRAAATTGAVGWCVQLVSVADGETGDPAFPAQGAGNCVSDTAKGTTLQENDASITGVTATGVAAGERLLIRVSRDANGSAVTDDMANDARGIGLELTIRCAGGC